MSLINVQNLTFAYDGSDKNVFENVSFQLDTNWELGLTGIMPCCTAVCILLFNLWAHQD